MSALLDYMRLCRLCLVKDKVNVPIFGGESDVRQIFLKITACLPVKVSQDDNLPKSICDSCLYKIDLLYQFWNTTVNAEKQLITWLAEIGVDVNIKNSNPPPLQAMPPQSHAHPHSITPPEALVLKEERPDPEIKQNFQENQNLYSAYEDLPYAPQVNMTVGAPQDFTQPEDVPLKEEKPSSQTPTKRRGRPPKQKTTPSSGVTITPIPATSSATSTTTAYNSNLKRRSSAAAAAARVAAAAAHEESDDSDIDDRLGGDDESDEDMDVTVAKEEADSEDEDYGDNSEGLEPTAFVDVPSTSADAEQPGPSGIGGGTTTGKMPTTATSTGTESGTLLPTVMPAPQYQIVSYMPLEIVLNPHCCRACPARFPSEIDLMKHRRDVHEKYDKPCKFCGKLFRYQSQANQHEKVVHHRSNRTKCDYCGKMIIKYNMHIHIKIHTKETTYKCDECDKIFYNEKALQEHKNTVHRGKRYICFPCNKSFKNEYYSKMHCKEKHDPDYKPKEQTCPECGKKFFGIYEFKHHVLLHNKSEDTHICDICGKTLTTKASFMNHKRIHSGEKPFACDICGKAFSAKRFLSTHNLIHTKEKPHKCEECGKCFTQRSTLTIHKRYHTGERPYECTICRKSFASKSQLNTHSKVHGTALSQISVDQKELMINK